MTPLSAALDAIDEYCRKNAHPEARVLRARTRAMLRAYDHIWGEQNERYEVLGVERPMLGPLKNLLTGKDSGYLAGGKLDVILREMDGRKRTVLMDHKTLSSQFDQDDIEHLTISAQPLYYAYLSWVNGQQVDDAMWDIVAKPKHVPRKESSRIVRAAKPERIASRKTVDAESGIEYKKGDAMPAVTEIREATPAETIEEFEERVFQLLIADKEKYFARPRVPALKQNIADHMHEAYLWTKELDMDSKNDTHLANKDRCMDYGRPCEYLGLCTGKSSVDDGTWGKREKLHAELDLPDGVDPHKVITNSRLGVFRACRLKHHRKYNLGLVKIGERPDDNLYVGSAAHVGFEHLWRAVGKFQGKNL